MHEEGNHLNKSEPQLRLSLALPGVWQATSNTEGEGYIKKENTIKMKLLIAEQDMVWIQKSYHKMLRTKYNKEDTAIIKSPCSETLYNNLNNFISKKP